MTARDVIEALHDALSEILEDPAAALDDTVRAAARRAIARSLAWQEQEGDK